MWTRRRTGNGDNHHWTVCRYGVPVGCVYLGMQIKSLRWFWVAATGGSGHGATMEVCLEDLRQSVTRSLDILKRQAEAEAQPDPAPPS